MEPEEHLLVLSACGTGLALNTATGSVLERGDLIAALIAREMIERLIL